MSDSLQLVENGGSDSLYVCSLIGHGLLFCLEHRLLDPLSNARYRVFSQLDMFLLCLMK